MVKRTRIILVVIRDNKGRDRLLPYRVSSEDGVDPLPDIEEDLDPGEKMLRYYDVPEGYITRNIVEVAELGASEVMGELEELIAFLVPIARDLALGREKK